MSSYIFMFNIFVKITFLFSEKFSLFNNYFSQHSSTTIYPLANTLVSDIKDKRDDRKWPEIVLNVLLEPLFKVPCGATV